MSEIALKLASSQRLSQALLLATLSYLNEHLMPLLFGVISDPSAHLQLLQIGWRVVLKMIERAASTDAEEAQAMAAEIKRSGAIHTILGHCQRITDSSKEAELMYRDGLRPRDVLPTALELLAVFIARTAHTPFGSAEPKEIEQALGQHIRQCQWTQTAASSKDQRSVLTLSVALLLFQSHGNASVRTRCRRSLLAQVLRLART